MCVFPIVFISSNSLQFPPRITKAPPPLQGAGEAGEPAPSPWQEVKAPTTLCQKIGIPPAGGWQGARGCGKGRQSPRCAPALRYLYAAFIQAPAPLGSIPLVQFSWVPPYSLVFKQPSHTPPLKRGARESGAPATNPTKQPPGQHAKKKGGGGTPTPSPPTATALRYSARRRCCSKEQIYRTRA